MPERIADIFEKSIDRSIEEVIKVDALDEQQLIVEIEEYYPTPSIQEQMARVLEAYASVHRSKTNDIGVWVSGFFGAGKSSFAKLLGVLLESRKVGQQDTIDLFSQRISKDEIKVLLRQIREHLPTHVVIFDILKDQLAGASEYPVTTVMYKALLRSLGYAYHSLELAELEINLEQQQLLDDFRDAYAGVHQGKQWDNDKQLVMVARNRASAALSRLDPATYPAADTWARTAAKVSITPRELARKALLLSQLRAQERNIVFVVDEIGQYTARRLERIGDLQGVVESFGQEGQGRIWFVGTSQEKLESIVDIYESDRTELVRLQDRFAHKVFLNPSDIREVASHRILSKKGPAEAMLRELYSRHSGRLRQLTNVSATVELPRLEEDAFVKLYPLLPYQVDLLIAIVSGLRRQASAPQTMGGANRTIIKLAQQLLIHDRVGIGEKPVGALVTLDSVYELLHTSISTEIHQEIDDIERTFGDGIATRVAKALALLQFADTVHTTEENIAAVLLPAVDAEGLEAEVREAVEQLIGARKVRRTESGLKIQSAAERTWDEERDSRRPGHGDRMRIIKEQLEQLWGQTAQRPQCQLGGWRRFAAGLRVGSEVVVDGDVIFDLNLLDASRDLDQQIKDARASTQDDQQLIAWTVELTDAAERAIEERHRSDRMLQARASARNPEEEALIRDERRRRVEENRRIDAELRKSLCRGRIFFRGNDRSPAEEASDPKAEAKRVLEPAVREIYHRFDEGAARVSSGDVEAVLRSENLAGLPNCYVDLGLVESDHGQAKLVTDRGAAKEVLDYIRQQTDLGQAPSGKELERAFTSPPYGWSFDLVRLLTATLLRDGQITLKAQSQQIKDALSLDARREISNNTRFRALTLTVREATLDAKQLRKAAMAMERRFGHHVAAIDAAVIAKDVRERLGNELGRVQTAHDLLRELGLPGATALGQGVTALEEIRRSDDEGVIHAFLENVDTLEKAIPRAQVIDSTLSDAAQKLLQLAMIANQVVGPVLENELKDDDSVREKLSALSSHLAKETFYEHLSAIRTATEAVLDRFQRLYDQAFSERQTAYQVAVEQLQSTAGWSQLPEADQSHLLQPLEQRAEEEPKKEPWQEAGSILQIIRAETEAASTRLHQAQEELQRILTPEAVRISVGGVFSGPITSEEELEAVLTAIRERVEQALAEGRPVLLV